MSRDTNRRARCRLRAPRPEPVDPQEILRTVEEQLAEWRIRRAAMRRAS